MLVPSYVYLASLSLSPSRLGITSQSHAALAGWHAYRVLRTLWWCFLASSLEASEISRSRRVLIEFEQNPQLIPGAA
jgi:hypothetical protein